MTDPSPAIVSSANLVDTETPPPSDNEKNLEAPLPSDDEEETELVGTESQE